MSVICPYQNHDGEYSVCLVSNGNVIVLFALNSKPDYLTTLSQREISRIISEGKFIVYFDMQNFIMQWLFVKSRSAKMGNEISKDFTLQKFDLSS